MTKELCADSSYQDFKNDEGQLMQIREFGKTKDDYKSVETICYVKDL